MSSSERPSRRCRSSATATLFTLLEWYCKFAHKRLPLSLRYISAQRCGDGDSGALFLELDNAVCAAMLDSLLLLSGYGKSEACLCVLPTVAREPNDAPKLTPVLGDFWLYARALRLRQHNHDFVNIREGLACLSEVSAAKPLERGSGLGKSTNVLCSAAAPLTDCNRSFLSWKDGLLWIVEHFPVSGKH